MINKPITELLFVE